MTLPQVLYLAFLWWFLGAVVLMAIATHVSRSESYKRWAAEHDDRPQHVAVTVLNLVWQGLVWPAMVIYFIAAARQVARRYAEGPA